MSRRTTAIIIIALLLCATAITLKVLTGDDDYVGQAKMHTGVLRSSDGRKFDE